MTLPFTRHICCESESAIGFRGKTQINEFCVILIEFRAVTIIETEFKLLLLHNYYKA